MSDMPDCYLICPIFECNHEEWVSPEDEVASFSEMWNHVLWTHANVDQAVTSSLMINVQEVQR